MQDRGVVLQTLTFLITGSEEEFRKANAELTAQLLTQTKQTVSIPFAVPTPTSVQDSITALFAAENARIMNTR